jgi:hypothetical protein
MKSVTWKDEINQLLKYEYIFLLYVTKLKDYREMKNKEMSATSFSAGILRQARRKFTGQENPMPPDNGCMIYVVVDEAPNDKQTNSFSSAVTTVTEV